MSAILQQLRERIERLEGLPPPGVATAAATGLAEIDRALPWGGLPRGVLHEFFGPDPADGAALRFLLRALAALMALEAEKPVVWASRHLDVFAPGLRQVGVDPSRMIFARCASQADLLFALEEGLHCTEAAAIVGETGSMDFSSSRRLQIAAQGNGATLLLLRPAHYACEASAAVTRWKIQARAGRSCEVQLLRCRGGRLGSWSLASAP